MTHVQEHERLPLWTPEICGKNHRTLLAMITVCIGLMALLIGTAAWSLSAANAAKDKAYGVESDLKVQTQHTADYQKSTDEKFMDIKGDLKDIKIAQKDLLNV